MEYLVGVVLALVVCGAAWWLGMDRERVFYPTMLMAVASYYVAFATVDGSAQILLTESLICAAFVAVAVIGFKGRLWWVAAAMAAHGAMDLVHHLFVHNTGVPDVWPGFCMSYDITAAACIGVMLALRHRDEQWSAGAVVKAPWRPARLLWKR